MVYMGSKISEAIINNEIDTSLKKVKEKAKKIYKRNKHTITTNTQQQQEKKHLEKYKKRNTKTKTQNKQKK